MACPQWRWVCDADAATHALAIVIVPAIVAILANIRRALSHDILRRLWPLMIGTVLGMCGRGLMTGPMLRHRVLGVLLVIYAIIGLSKVRFSVPRGMKMVGASLGFTGVISAATGVQVIPSMPFMQAIGMEKDELVRRSACSSTATVAQVQLTGAGLLNARFIPGSWRSPLSRRIGQCARGWMPTHSGAGF